MHDITWAKYPKPVKVIGKWLYGIAAHDTISLKMFSRFSRIIRGNF